LLYLHFNDLYYRSVELHSSRKLHTSQTLFLFESALTNPIPAYRACHPDSVVLIVCVKTMRAYTVITLYS